MKSASSSLWTRGCCTFGDVLRAIWVTKLWLGSKSPAEANEEMDATGVPQHQLLDTVRPLDTWKCTSMLASAEGNEALKTLTWRQGLLPSDLRPPCPVP